MGYTMKKSSEKRLQLMFPPFYRLYGNDEDDASHNVYPLGIGYLAATVRKHTDWKVQAVVGDARFEQSVYFNMPLIRMAGSGFDNYLACLRTPDAPIWQEMEQHIADFAPDVLGLSATSQNWKAATMVAAIAKRLNPEVVVITGGPHSSMAGEKVLECPDIDINVVGEGEETMLDILSALETGRDLSTVDGISYRDSEGKIKKNKPRAFVGEVDDIPFPAEAAPYVLKDYDKFPLEAFRSMFSIRACPYNCQFCGSRTIWGRTSRFRSPENVVAEMKFLEGMGIKHVHFEDDLFGIKPKYIQDLCGLIEKELPDMTWSGELTVTTISDQNLAAMKASGCIAISYGVESGNNEMLKIIRKTQDVDGIRRSAELLRKHDIRSSAFFMIGFPEETEETLNDTIELMKDLDVDNIVFSIFTPYPDTEMFHICEKKGLIPDDYDISLYNHQSLENCFTDKIPPARFRQIATESLELVDKLNQEKMKVFAEREKLKSLDEMTTDEGPGRTALAKELVGAFVRSMKKDGVSETTRKIVKYIKRRDVQEVAPDPEVVTNVTGPTYYQQPPQQQ